jgi:hypothetical protein
MNVPRSALWFALLVLSACNSRPESVSETFESPATASGNREFMEVIYSMYLPTDLTVIFQRSGANYDPGIPAPTDDISLYVDHEQIAVMLGIYGVDITYMKMLEQQADAAAWINSMRNLAAKSGLPPSLIEEASASIEAAFKSDEPLTSAIEDIYRETDRYFRKKGEEHLAALSLLGGWVEAMYIGAEIYETNAGNNGLAEKLLQQKFSLNSLYAILSNHQESLSVKSYLLMIRRLRNIYENVEIRYQKEGFSVDTTRKKIRSYSAEITYDAYMLKEIIDTIRLIRAELIRTNADR